MEKRKNKTKKKKPSKDRLGRGLSALFPENNKSLSLAEDLLDGLAVSKEKTLSKNEVITEASLAAIRANPHQPRKKFQETELKNLAQSIQNVGIIQPLIVQKTKEQGVFQLISGERRLRAAKLAGLSKVPIFIRPQNDDNKEELFHVMLIENIQRSDLNPLEEAHAYAYLLKQENLRQEDLAKQVGKSRSHVANMLRLLKAPPRLQKLLIEGKLSFTQARPLLTLNAEHLDSLLAKIAAEGMPVRFIEKEAAMLSDNDDLKPKHFSSLAPSGRLTKASKTSHDIDPFLKTMEEQLQERLFTKVGIQRIHGKVGKIEIEYYDYPQLEDLLSKLLSSPKNLT